MIDPTPNCDFVLKTIPIDNACIPIKKITNLDIDISLIL